MMKKVLITFATIAVAAASAATYNVQLLEPSVVNGNLLKAGDYKLEVKNDTAVFKAGRKATEAKVKVETAGQKFGSTSFRYDRATDGSLKLQEVRIGGSTTKLGIRKLTRVFPIRILLKAHNGP